MLTMKVLKRTRTQFKVLLRDKMVESSADDMVLHAGFDRLQSLVRCAPYHSCNENTSLTSCTSSFMTTCKVGLFSNFGQMSFLTSPITHMN